MKITPNIFFMESLNQNLSVKKIVFEDKARFKRPLGFFKEKIQNVKSSVSSKVSSSEELVSQPVIVDKEWSWDKSLTLMSKTDKYGTIEFANDVFIEISGYEDYELIGSSHNIIRHPDMPKVVFKMLWESLKKGENFYAVIKNLTKTGYYYWVVTTFEIGKNSNGEITNFTGYRKAVPKEMIDEVIAPLYRRLLKIEQASGIAMSEKYLNGYLEQENKSYMEYITDVMVKYTNNKAKDKKSFFAKFFGK